MTTRRSPRRRWISVRLTARDVAHDLEQRHSLRWHGLCIGTLTLLGMLLAAWLQKQAGVHLLSVRYAITLAVGYGIYLLVLRWWAARLLDEPLITLDHATTKAVIERIRLSRQQGISFLLSSHQDVDASELPVDSIWIVQQQTLASITQPAAL